MATLVAPAVVPPTSAIHIQNALSSLPSTPISIPQANQGVICSVHSQLRPGQTSSAACDSTTQYSRTTPPPTPTAGSSSVTAAQLVPNAAPPGTLTPQTPVLAAIALEDCQKLPEAYIDAMTPIDPEIDRIWRQDVKDHLDAILNETVRSRCVQQELMYAAPRGLLRSIKRIKHTDMKPSIVISVANPEDRTRVKRRIKQLEWLQKDINRCKLRLMVLIDPVKL